MSSLPAGRYGTGPFMAAIAPTREDNRQRAEQLQRFTSAQLEIKCLRGLIEDLRTRERQTIQQMDYRKKMHPLSLENSRQAKRMKSAMYQTRQTADFLEAYLAILEQRNDL